MNDQATYSEIPFVNDLGAAFETAITPVPSRRPRVGRSWIVAFALVVTLVVAAVAVGRVLTSPDELAVGGIACYSAPDLGSDMTVVADDASPAAACAAALHGDARASYVACTNGSGVAVFPGSDASLCARLKLQPLPAGFAASQARVVRLGAGIAALEAQSDCPAAPALARSVQRLLDAQGWAGWTTEVRTPSHGPCASVSLLDGGGNRSVHGALDPVRRVVMVSTGAARSTMTLLYGAGGLAPALEQASAERCYTAAGLTALVASRARAAGRVGAVEVAPPLAPSTTIGDGRGPRYAAGCAIVTDVRPAADGRGVVAVVPRTSPH